MPAYSAPIPTKIFHITDIDNLRNILLSNELKAKNILDRSSVKYRNIAYINVQGNRKNTMVPISKGGNLHDYVPFYFAPRSPMLDAIHHGKVKEYIGGQEDICHIVTNVQKIDNANLNYVFTNYHAITQPIDFFSSIKDINQVD